MKSDSLIISTSTTRILNNIAADHLALRDSCLEGRFNVGKEQSLLVFYRFLVRAPLVCLPAVDII